ncbi:uncharacterized protein isoform X2 [Musca autumnalis]
MVFSPQSAPPPTPNSPPPPPTTEEPVVIKTTPLETVAPKISDETTINPTKLKPSPTTTTVKTSHEEESTTKSKVTEVKTSTTKAITTTTAAKVPASQVNAQEEPAQTTTPTTSTSKTKPVQTPKIVTQEAASSSSSSASTPSSSTVVIDNVVHDPEYDLLSRQPPQYVEENYRVVSLKPNNRNSRPAVVVTPEKNSAPTSSVLATKVTASAASSSSRSHKNKKHKIRASSTLQVLKTAAPVSHPKVSASSSKLPSHRSSSTSGSSSRKSSKKGSHRTTTTTTTTPQPQEDVVIVKSSSSSSSSSRNKPKRKNKNKHSSSSSSSSSSSTTKPRYSNSGTTTTTTTEATVKRAFKPKLQISNPDLESNNNLHITKLNRTPGRWQYKTSPKPRVPIRKPSIEVNGPLGLANVTSVYPESSVNDNFQNNNFLNGNGIYNQSDLDFEGSQNGAVLNNIDQEGKQKYFTETINVEISTPADFKDTYYEIATIKKPFIFQAGVLKKTRYITVTSTIEKFLTSEPSIEPRNDDEPLTENILAATERPSSGLLMGSVSTLAPIYVNNDSYTPYLETVTESFSVVNQKLKTQILPVINELHNVTSYHTLVQTIDMTSLITVVKTTSPDMETKDFHGFQDFVGNLDEAGSEINLDLEFGDEGNNPESSHESSHHHKHHFDLDGLGNRTMATAILPTLTTDPQNLLANVITNSRPVIKLETLWESYVVPITNGPSTFYRTLSKAKGVVEKTEYVVDTTTVPAPILPPTSIPNPFLLPQLQQYQTITTPVVQQTIVTQTQSKILKLTFGAKTAYTTLYSTQVVPTQQTTYVTTSVPVQPTANPFPGYFPPGYNPFAYLG